mmetsp:Transcript_19469/g.54736  ORF Transcript_19469/g.54736 Transcript_19469/m.54736 type:complete len:450 (-) Transcript_19469:1370-2719(-)
MLRPPPAPPSPPAWGARVTLFSRWYRREEGSGLSSFRRKSRPVLSRKVFRRVRRSLRLGPGAATVLPLVDRFRLSLTSIICFSIQGMTERRKSLSRESHTFLVSSTRCIIAPTMGSSCITLVVPSRERIICPPRNVVLDLFAMRGLIALCATTGMSSSSSELENSTRTAFRFWRSRRHAACPSFVDGVRGGCLGGTNCWRPVGPGKASPVTRSSAATALFASRSLSSTVPRSGVVRERRETMDSVSGDEHLARGIGGLLPARLLLRTGWFGESPSPPGVFFFSLGAGFTGSWICRLLRCFTSLRFTAGSATSAGADAPLPERDRGLPTPTCPGEFRPERGRGELRPDDLPDDRRERGVLFPDRGVLLPDDLAEDFPEDLPDDRLECVVLVGSGPCPTELTVGFVFSGSLDHCRKLWNGDATLQDSVATFTPSYAIVTSCFPSFSGIMAK